MTERVNSNNIFSGSGDQDLDVFGGAVILLTAPPFKALLSCSKCLH